MGLIATIGLTSLLAAASGPQDIAEIIEASSPPSAEWKARGGGDRLLCPRLRPGHGARGVLRRHGLPGAELARPPARPARRGGPEAGVRQACRCGADLDAPAPLRERAGAAPVPRRAGGRGRRARPGHELGGPQRQVLRADGPEAIPLRPPGAPGADRRLRGRVGREVRRQARAGDRRRGGHRVRLDGRQPEGARGRPSVRARPGGVPALRICGGPPSGGRRSTSGG